MAIVSQIMPMIKPLPPNHPSVMWIKDAEGEPKAIYHRGGYLTDERGNAIINTITGKATKVKDIDNERLPVKDGSLYETGDYD